MVETGYDRGISHYIYRWPSDTMCEWDQLFEMPDSYDVGQG